MTFEEQLETLEALEAQLATLSQALGVLAVLGKPEELQDEDPEVKPISGQQSRPADTSAQKEVAQGQAASEVTDAPVKFHLHDIGPRPCTDGAFDCSDFTVGEPAGDDMEFCPWKVVVDYPNHFIGNTNRPHVKPFFVKIFANMIWDFFYIFDPTSTKEKPFFMVPSSQFQIFLDKINKELDIALSIPAGVNADRFLMKFGQGNTPRPRYIGRAENKPFNLDEWPPLNAQDVEDFQAASAILQQDFEDKMKKMKLPPARDRNHKSKTKSARKRADREHMLAEVQRLLGLKGWVSVPEMVFVSIDVEAIERPPNPISEVGIVILDSKDIRQIAPGDLGEPWWGLVKCHHLRTMEYSGLVNREYVVGCPDAFDFGTSTFPTKADLPDAIRSILEPYLSSGREIALVGHDIQQDIRYLSSIGIELADMQRVTRVLDSQAMHQVWRDIDNGRGLQALLNDLGITAHHLHNAGNDAVFTLRALIGIALEDIRKQAAQKNGEEYEPIGWKIPPQTD